MTGLNHITLATTDLVRSIEFYRDPLGFELKAQWNEGAYLKAGQLWLCLTLQDHPIADRSNDYTHIAFSVEDSAFEVLAHRLRQICTIWKENRSEGQSLYFLDPDGHRLEIHVGDLQTRLSHYRNSNRDGVRIY